MEGVWIKVEELEKLKQQIAELEAERDWLHHKSECLNMERKSQDRELAALRRKIDEAPVVAWEYVLKSPDGVLTRQASTTNWDERYQPYGRPGIDYATGLCVDKHPLISKEELK